MLFLKKQNKNISCNNSHFFIVLFKDNDYFCHAELGIIE
jgi:hypothetical protein